MKREKKTEKQRTGYIGGSDAAVIMGMNPWKNRVQLWQEKVGEVQPADLSGNSRVQWGIKLEDLVARHWAEVTGKKIRRNNYLLRSEKWPWMAAHLDREVIGGGFLEVKTAGMAKEWGEDGSSSIPDHYMCQVQHYMAVTGSAKCWVAVLIGGSDFRSYEIQRNDEFISLMAQAQEAFWKLVQDGTPPEPLTSDEAVDRWPASDQGKTAAATGEVLEAVQQLVDIDAQIKELQESKKQQQLVVMNAMQEAELLMAGGSKVASWKSQTASRLDTKKLKDEMPEVAAKYMKESSSRTFRIHLK